MDNFVHSFLFGFISVPVDFPPFRAGAKKIDCCTVGLKKRKLISTNYLKR